MPDTDYPEALSDVNKAIRSLGVKFVRGAGYYYPIALNGSWAGEGVYVYRVSGLTLGQWMKEAKEQKMKFSRTAAQVAKVFKAPEKIENADNLPSVFEAGAIDMGKADDWQKELADHLKDVPCIILNPRRNDWDSSWKQEIENDQFREQVEWELDGMEQATVVAMALTKDSKAPISLLELGLHASDGKMIVFCPDGFYRKGNVDIVCKRYGVPVFEDFEEFTKKVRERLTARGAGVAGRITASNRIARRMIARQFVAGMLKISLQMVKPWTDAYGNPAQDYTGADWYQMQALRRRPDYGEKKMDITERVLAMKDSDFISRSEVAQMCPLCADKMEKNGLKAVRAHVIKASIYDSAFKAAVKDVRVGQ